MTTQLLTVSDLKDISYAPLLTERGFHPCGHYRNLSSDHLRKYNLERLHADTRCWTAESAGIRMLLGIRDTEWDTEQLGFPCARVEILSVVDGDNKPSGKSETVRKLADNLLDAMHLDCRSRGVQYLIARIPSSATDIAHVMQQREYLLVDGLINYHYDLSSALPETLDIPDIVFRQGNTVDIPQCLHIASRSYALDRFHTDPLISQERADQVHRLWVENSFRKISADQVWVAEFQHDAQAYITGSIDKVSQQVLPDTIGHVGLVAAGQAVRGKGVATALCVHALHGFHQMGVQHVEVGTQITNITAQRIYQKAGFRPINSFLTFRRWIEP